MMIVWDQNEALQDEMCQEDWKNGILQSDVEDVIMEEGNQDEMLQILNWMLFEYMIIDLDYADIIGFLKGGPCTYFTISFSKDDIKQVVTSKMKGRICKEAMILINWGGDLKEVGDFFEAFHEFAVNQPNVRYAFTDGPGSSEVGKAYIWLR